MQNLSHSQVLLEFVIIFFILVNLMSDSVVIILKDITLTLLGVKRLKFEAKIIFKYTAGCSKYTTKMN